MNKMKKLLLINPGASLTGAPILFLNTIKWFRKNMQYNCTILISQNGPLEDEFKKYYPTYNWDDEDPAKKIEKYYFFRLLIRIRKKLLPIRKKTYREKLINLFEKEKFDLIYANTVASCTIIQTLKKRLTSKVLLHVRELEIAIQQFSGVELFDNTIPLIDYFISVSESVKTNLVSKHRIEPELISTVFEYISLEEAQEVLNKPPNKDLFLEDNLKLPSEAFVVISSGTTDWRKGADLLVQIAKKVHSQKKLPIHFIWVGGDNRGLNYEKLLYDLKKAAVDPYVHFIGTKTMPLKYFYFSDIFMLCSREEPVGLVALEAASLKKPVLCFKGAGGLPEFVEEDCGFVVPYLDIDAMSARILQLYHDRTLLNVLGDNAAQKVKQHDINVACKEITTLIESMI
jgi:glycosyltransferase involved in cell wall biosynthesis